MKTKQAEFTLSAKDRAELEKIVRDGNAAQKVAKRAKIVLMTADGAGVMAIMRTIGVSKTTVWRWQQYFVEAGVAGVIKGRSKPPGKKPIPEALIPFPELIESKYYGIEAPSAGVNCIRELGCDSLGPSDLIRTNRWSNAPKSRFGV